MTVSSMFTQGYMEDPTTVALVVNPTQDLAAQLASDALLLGTVLGDPNLEAVVGSDAEFLAAVEEAEFAAVVGRDAELQATIVRDADLLADVGCEE